MSRSRNAVARNLRRDQLDAVVSIMRTVQGRAYMYALLTRCHVYSTSFSTNALSMAFAEGQRNVGIWIGADLTEADPELYNLMLKEAEYGRRDAERERAGNGHDDGDDTSDGDIANA